MAFSMSYDNKPPPAPAKKAEKAAATEPAKPQRTGRAARPNSPHARAEALFQKKAPTPDGE